MYFKLFGRIFGINVARLPGDHDDAGGPLLPHHAPEVADGRLRRALRHDVGLRLRQTLTREVNNLYEPNRQLIRSSSHLHVKFKLAILGDLREM